MTRSATETVEFSKQKALLEARVGVRGSGAARYAAAMYFYQQDLMPVDMLEIYRRCSKFDFEDPVDLANFEGIETLATLTALKERKA